MSLVSVSHNRILRTLHFGNPNPNGEWWWPWSWWAGGYGGASILDGNGTLKVIN
ncbi:hypothetical protein BVC80_8421g1 [Macleaya cordata]|uniref:Uncharacterized protein n=1 Tax=Macleaya cordata TaxID=56857 RepID=A0A200QXI0_MACCD|nr:hypothetical protein BVC80_8421g1 [Macleaya cordata]